MLVLLEEILWYVTVIHISRLATVASSRHSPYKTTDKISHTFGNNDQG